MEIYRVIKILTVYFPILVRKGGGKDIFYIVIREFILTSRTNIFIR